MNRTVLAIAVAVCLSACSSAVKLDDVAVEDRTGRSAADVNASANAGAAAGVGQSTVNGVTLNNNSSSSNDAMMASKRVVYFDYDSFAIRPEFQSVIEAHAKFIKADKSKRVAVEGHTDERGGREYNLALGQKRAEAVRRALALLGVQDSQIEAVSFGKEKPAVEGSSESAMEKNRRAEIFYR